MSRIIKGGLSIDDRGTVAFVNDFDFQKIKRFYVVKNFSPNSVRAFHGHKLEEKYIYVASGAALIATAKIFEGGLYHPDKFVLTECVPQILHIPAMYANGFKTLAPRTRIVFFSTATLEESKSDDFRFNWATFGEDFWEVANR